MKRRKRLTRGLLLQQNKLFFGSFMGLIAMVLLINATFAWTSYAKWLDNHMQTVKEKEIRIVPRGELSGKILTQTKALRPQLTIENTGEVPVLIRVSLEEVLLTLAVDTTDETGNGHLATYTGLAGKAEVLLDTPSTWQIGGRYTPGGGVYYETNQLATYAYRQAETSRPSLLTHVGYTWGPINPPTPPVSGGYWLYEEQGGKGYYYYSDIVLPGEETAVLVDQVQLKAQAPNGLKSSFYQLKVNAEGGQANSGVYDDWQLTKTVGNAIYDRYHVILGGT